METSKLTLTATDLRAIDLLDSDYLNSKGAKQYGSENYADAVEYYRLAAAMGNSYAISNLGYCYLYGRHIEANLSLAIAYFKIAASGGDVDAAYKLGDIYSSDKWGVKDQELSIYYYRMAVGFVLAPGWENSTIIAQSQDLVKYPSLCYALGRELSIGGAMNTDLSAAYQFLLKAKIGYKYELMNGSRMYEKCYADVLDLLADAQFDEVRPKESSHA